ncbi:nucleotidyltransferase domain-containing protein [Wenzhouxiangella sp. EGI_FJ10305]|uniref:nucleotidyltransferase domain-containing protein n=1 Tax=Wenzhouxiangella sp. EGI_FJ10305 TaxID=3243768 RepID=UPI0035DFC1DD
MRITEQQHQVILSAARRAFGPNVTVRLFGSRTNDQRKGGDFDLYVECDSDDADWLNRAKLKFLCELDRSKALAGEKVDVVLSTPLHREPRAIDRVARLEGVRL